jgi:4'-phosphopantetheinyl transferase
LKRQIGIDIELIKPISDMNRMVELYFSKLESEVFTALPEAIRTGAFYSAWTRKEAYLKSIGEGLQQPPDQVEVSMNPLESYPELKLLDRDLPRATIRLLSFQPAEGYQAALAVEGKSWDVLAIDYANSIN